MKRICEALSFFILPKTRSKRYIAKKSLIETDKTLPLDEAIPLIKKLNYAKFDASIEAHFNLDLNVGEEGQNIRTTVDLPHGTGKKVSVLVFSTADVKGADKSGGEELIEKISKGKINPLKFNVILATPELMPKVASLGKVLGPQGLMPNPKAGTVVKDPQKATRSFKKGKVALQTDNPPAGGAPVIHVGFGKVSFKDEELIENFNAILNAIKENKPKKAEPNFIKSVYIATSQSPSIQVSPL